MNGPLATAAMEAAAPDDPKGAQFLPFVSVVIPVRNDARRLAVCLASLAKQDYPAECYEVIVVDNGSDDGSRDVAHQAGAQVYCFPQLRVGALRNRGVAAGVGQILAFVDSDHEVPVHWIRRGALELHRNAGVQMIGSPYLAPAGGSWVQRTWELHRLRDRTRREVDWLATGNLFMRRSDFTRVGGFNEDLVAAEDVDLCVRLAANAGTIISDMQVANVHHGEPKTLWQFFKKEYWRGSSGIRAFFAHGMPLHEVPSLVWPLFHLLAAMGLAAAVIYGAVALALLAPLLALGILLVPSVLLAVKSSWQVRKLSAIPPLTLLYLTYGLCRAAAIFKR